MPATSSQKAALRAQIAAAQRQLRDIEEVESGDKPSSQQAALIRSQPFSFGVSFLRRKAKKGVASFVSNRRFSSAQEAEQHGKRFTKKHKHESFLVVYITNKRANAWINWTTGKTNPAV